MSNAELDRRLSRRLLLDDSPSQEALAEEIGIDRQLVARRLSALQRAGTVVLQKTGRLVIPRLSIFSQFDALRASITSLRASMAR